MDEHRRAFGPDRDISRRDFMNGVASAAGSLARPTAALAAVPEVASETAANDYPPRSNAANEQRYDALGLFHKEMLSGL